MDQTSYSLGVSVQMGWLEWRLFLIDIGVELIDDQLNWETQDDQMHSYGTDCRLRPTGSCATAEDTFCVTQFAGRSQRIRSLLALR